MRILIAEDDFDARQILSRQLALYGTCDIAVDGEEAVRAVRMSLEKGKPYDLICLDIMMPKMDGQAALKAIRALEKEQALKSWTGSIIVMTTALADTDNVTRALENACNAYLVKPIKKNVLKNKLLEVKVLRDE